MTIHRRRVDSQLLLKPVQKLHHAWPILLQSPLRAGCHFLNDGSGTLFPVRVDELYIIPYKVSMSLIRDMQCISINSKDAEKALESFKNEMWTSKPPRGDVLSRDKLHADLEAMLHIVEACARCLLPCSLPNQGPGICTGSPCKQQLPHW